MNTVMNHRLETDRSIRVGIRTSKGAERVTVLEKTQAQFAETLADRTSAARGALTGILLSVGIWAGVIACLLVILQQ